MDLQKEFPFYVKFKFMNCVSSKLYCFNNLIFFKTQLTKNYNQLLINKKILEISKRIDSKASFHGMAEAK